MGQERNSQTSSTDDLEPWLHPLSRRAFLAKVGLGGIALTSSGGLLTGCSRASTETASTPQAAGSTGGGSGKLVVNSFGGSWNEGHQLGFIDGFQQETGIEVTLLSTWDIAKSSAAVESGNLPPEDILDNALPFAAPLQRDGLLADIDYDRFDPDVLDALPESAKASYALDYGGFAFALAYDGDVYPAQGDQPTNWADMWDLERFPGARGMMDWSIEPQPEFALLADGVDPKDLYPIDIDRALRKMEELRPHIPKFYDATSAYVQSLVDRQVVMHPGYTHRLRKLMAAGLDRIQISYEQARVSTQAFTVWKNAPNSESAMAFLAYIVRPDVQGRWAQSANTIPIHPGGFEYIPSETRKQLSAVEDGTAWPVNWEWYAEFGEDDKTNLELVSQRWTEWLEQG